MNVVAIRGMNDVFELFFVRGEMIVLHTSLMILKKNKNWAQKSEFIWHCCQAQKPKITMKFMLRMSVCKLLIITVHK